jgi:hypothetical protein
MPTRPVRPQAIAAGVMLGQGMRSSADKKKAVLK